MKKILFGVFAHPDDEAFCVAATLLHEVSKGTQVHLVSLTDGNGKHSANPDNVPDLGKTRLDEWQTAGKLIGATSQTHYGYIDGTIGNNDHIDIAKRIENQVIDLLKEDPDVEIDFITLEMDGFTGHIDHIVASRSAYMAFLRLREQDLPVKRLRFACLSEDEIPYISTDFTLWEAGWPKQYINETVELPDRIDKIREIMFAHHSQRSDAQFWIDKLGDKIAVNHFMVID
jgi:LmbE family N-acetylglucosaminyl deacetylase